MIFSWLLSPKCLQRWLLKEIKLRTFLGHQTSQAFIVGAAPTTGKDLVSRQTEVRRIEDQQGRGMHGVDVTIIKQRLVSSLGWVHLGTGGYLRTRCMPGCLFSKKRKRRSLNHQARASICSVPLTAFGKNALFTISIYIYILQTDSLRYGTVEKSTSRVPKT